MKLIRGKSDLQAFVKVKYAACMAAFSNKIADVESILCAICNRFTVPSQIQRSSSYQVKPSNEKDIRK